LFISVIAVATSNDSLFIDNERQEYDSIVSTLYTPVVECSFDATLPYSKFKRKLSATSTSIVQTNTIPTATINKSKAVGET